jgi:hypothetical protein
MIDAAKLTVYIKSFLRFQLSLQLEVRCASAIMVRHVRCCSGFWKFGGGSRFVGERGASRCDEYFVDFSCAAR